MLYLNWKLAREGKPLQDAAYFTAKMQIAADRLGLEWPNRVDFSADGLRFRAFPEETEAEFSAVAPSPNSGPLTDRLP